MIDDEDLIAVEERYIEIVADWLHNGRMNFMKPMDIQGVYIRRLMSLGRPIVVVVVRPVNRLTGKQYVKDNFTIRSLDHLLDVRDIIESPRFITLLKAIDRVNQENSRVRMFM